MNGIQTRLQTIAVGDHFYTIETLMDCNQFHDPDGSSAASGFGDTNWSLFGQIWPSSRMLALVANTFDIKGKRILEIGAGLGLASLVLQNRGADITVSDANPMAKQFFTANLKRNSLAPLDFVSGDWTDTVNVLGLFDVIIGSDVLYERQHADEVSAFIALHTFEKCEVIITEPNRGNRASFCSKMNRYGFSGTHLHANHHFVDGLHYEGRVLNFSRNDLRVK
jgi:2-polyprenyl-3-methyl-5-hydroxy-6-metoxy-1,4-benzoquinol methylase